MKKATIATCLATVLCATSVKADTLLGLYIGGQVWVSQAEGSFGEGEEVTLLRLNTQFL